MNTLAGANRAAGEMSAGKGQLLGGPVFLIGAERSGTTLLRIMLDHHPDLAFRNEFEFAVDLVGDDGAWPGMDAYLRHLRLSRTFAMSGFDIDPALDYPSLVRSFLEQKRELDGKRCVGATVHRNFERLLHIWPRACFIHLVRDGRDVARSRVRAGWAGNAWVAAHEWVRVEEQIERLADRVGAGRVTHVSYENLVRDPHRSVQRLCEFMGLPFCETMLEFDESWTYDRPNAAHAERWKATASRREISLIESVQSEMLARRGYAPSGIPVRKPGLVRTAWLRAHSRIGRSRFRLRRYGVRLWLVEILSRRLGMRAKWERTQLAISEIQREHLQ